MKQISTYIKKTGILLLGLFALACSSDDDNDNGGDTGDELSSENTITNFTFLAADSDALSEDIATTINDEEKMITAEVPHGTAITALVPTIEISEGAIIDPENKTEMDFTDVVTYTVTAEDGSEAHYAVTISVAKSDAKAIIAFSFLAADNEVLTEDAETTIDEEEKVITTKVPFGTDVSGLVPTITVSDAATVDPGDKTAADFTDAVTYTVTAEDGSEAEYTASITVGPSGAKAITNFTFLAGDNDALTEDLVGAIDQDARTITLEVPYGTEITELVPTIEISEGAVVDPESKVKTDFTDAVTYTVTAEDGSEAEYTASITVGPSGAKAITTFTFLATDNEMLTEDLVGTIDEDTKTITAELLYGTDVSGLVPTITISEDATVDPENKTATDFTNMVTYTVTAEDGSEAEYTVSVTVPPSGAKAITTFTFLATDNEMLTEDLVGIINEDAKTITAEVPYGTDINGLVSTIEISEGAVIDPEDKTAADFTNVVIYTVTAEDGSEAEYTITVAILPPTEREILIDLYNANPNNTLGWDLPGDISQWGGVTLGDDGSITELRLGQSNLDYLPSSIGYLINLELLYLDYNSLTSVPSELGNLTNLKNLWLQDNSLTSVPGELGELSNLQRLYLYNNSLTSIPSELGNLTNLRILWLQDNSLTSVPGALGELSNLEGLYLTNNSLTSVPSELGNLTNLKKLRFHNNSLMSVPEALGNLTNLEELNFSGNDLTSIPSTLGNLTNLTDLNLHNNSLTSVPSELGNLINLEQLWIYDNQITSIPKEICDLDIDDFRKDNTAICEE